MAPAAPSSSAPPVAPLGRVALLSLGCAKNLADSERLVGDLVGAGFVLADGIEEADLALVNTCGFIDPAKEESIDTILAVAQRKDFGRLRGLIVAGCLVERYAKDLAKQIPEVDRWMPFNDYPKIVAAARELMGLPRRARRVRVEARAAHARGLRLPEDQRGVRPEVHLLRDSLVPRQARLAARSRTTSPTRGRSPPRASAR